MEPYGKRVPINTAAGTLMVYTFFDPWAPPTKEDVDLLHEHLKTIKLPTAIWQRFAYALGFARVSECRSMASLLALWVWLADWQRMCAAVVGTVGHEEFKIRMPGSSIGRDVFEQVLTDRVKVIAPEDAPKPGELEAEAKKPKPSASPENPASRSAAKSEPGEQLFAAGGKSLTP